MFDFSNYFARSKYYSNVLVAGKMKDKMGGVAIEEFVLVCNSSEYKIAEGLNKIFVAKIGHNEYEDVL